MTGEVPVVRLTPGEFRVARAFLFDGCSNWTIARRLQRSEDTVKTHMKHLMHKVDVRYRSELAVRFWSGRVDLSSPTNPSMRETQQRMIPEKSPATP